MADAIVKVRVMRSDRSSQGSLGSRGRSPGRSGDDRRSGGMPAPALTEGVARHGAVREREGTPDLSAGGSAGTNVSDVSHGGGVAVVGEELSGGAGDGDAAAPTKSGMSTASQAGGAGPLLAQQLLQQMVRKSPSHVDKMMESPAEVDSALWQYEHLRQITSELSLLVVVLRTACTAESCPVMKATDEWQYLCAAHKSPQECCAIDYAVHTLDGTTALLCSSKMFPSRISVKESSLSYFRSIARRLYRIFAHAHFHHRAEFVAFERVTHLCRRVDSLSRKHSWISSDQLIIPVKELSDVALK